MKINLINTFKIYVNKSYLIIFLLIQWLNQIKIKLYISVKKKLNCRKSYWIMEMLISLAPPIYTHGCVMCVNVSSQTLTWILIKITPKLKIELNSKTIKLVPACVGNGQKNIYILRNQEY